MRRHEMRRGVGDRDVGTLGVLGGSTYFPEEAEGWRSQAELGAWKTKASWRVPGRIFSPSTTPGHSAQGAGMWPCHARQHTQQRCSGTISEKETQHKPLLDGKGWVQI